jgi:glycosyltransferase involved in cell wall biosynthesis
MPNNNKDFKLLLAAVFPPGSAGGDWVLLKHLLRGFDWSRLSWWSMFGQPPDRTTPLGDRLACFNAPGRLSPNLRWQRTKGLIFESIIVPRAAEHLRDFIRREKPDMLWLISFGWSIPVLHRVVPRLGIPWHFSMHDMPDTAPAVRSLGAGRAARFMQMQRDLYAGATSRNVVCEAMAVEMEKTTGIKPELTLRCSVEPEAMEVLRKPPALPANPSAIRIGYAGTIIAEETFALFVAALQQIRGELPLPVEIHLFSAHDYKSRPWFDPSLIIDHGLVSHADLQKPYGECTWGLAIMHMGDDDPRYNRFSFPCKFTQALASGLPLICLGHAQSSLMQLAEKYRLGLMFTEPGADGIANTLRSGLADFSRFGEYRREALRCAENEFSAEKFRRALHSLFQARL